MVEYFLANAEFRQPIRILPLRKENWMPPVLDRIDIESLLRDAISSITVASFSHQIGVSAHIDNRLPILARGDARALSDYIRRGLAGTIKAGRVERIALAFWLDDTASEGGEARIRLEAGCAGQSLQEDG